MRFNQNKRAHENKCQKTKGAVRFMAECNAELPEHKRQQHNRKHVVALPVIETAQACHNKEEAEQEEGFDDWRYVPKAQEIAAAEK